MDPHAEDARLMAQVAAGEQAASRLLAQRHLPGAFGLACRLLGDQAEAEEIAQEAFIRLWRQAATWRADARVSTWLYQVVRNLCLDVLRKKRPVNMEELPDTPDPRGGPVEVLQQKEKQARLQAALAALPERQRAAVTLVHHLGHGNQEAARIMGVGVEALESLLSRGRRKLKVLLADLAKGGA